MPDTVDSPVAVKDIILDNDNQERRSWIFFGQKVARSQVLFLVQVLLVLLIVGISIANLSLTNSCEAKSVWIATLSSSVGYMLPAPHL